LSQALVLWEKLGIKHFLLGLYICDISNRLLEHSWILLSGKLVFSSNAERSSTLVFCLQIVKTGKPHFGMQVLIFRNTAPIYLHVIWRFSGLNVDKTYQNAKIEMRMYVSDFRNLHIQFCLSLSRQLATVLDSITIYISVPPLKIKGQCLSRFVLW